MRALAVRATLLWVLAAAALGLVYADSQRINASNIFCQHGNVEMFFNPQVGHWDSRYLGCFGY